MGKHTRHSRSDVGLRRYDAESERFETYAEESQWRTQADSPDIAWKLFAASARRSPAARRALRAFRERERVVRMAEAKFEETARVLRMFPGEQAVLFCGGTDVAMEVSRRLAIPLIAASTPASERHAILGAMRDGTLRAVASVKVLDEGWDVPNAKLGIVLGDSTRGGARQHTQRLGWRATTSSWPEACCVMRRAWNCTRAVAGTMSFAQSRRQDSCTNWCVRVNAIG